VIETLPEDIAWIYFKNLAPTVFGSFEEIDHFEKFLKEHSEIPFEHRGMQHKRVRIWTQQALTDLL
jgi:hypothetical protein